MLMVRECVIGYVYVSSVPIISSEYSSIYNFNQHTYTLSKASKMFSNNSSVLMVRESDRLCIRFECPNYLE